MAAMSIYLQEQMLDWIENGHEWNAVPSWHELYNHVPKPDLPLPAPPPIELGAPAVVALGVAAIAAKNPVISRRFWGRRPPA